MAGARLSVVMTAYNAHRYLSTALDSIVRQADEGVEVIAVDDGSTDDTREILEGYRTKLDLKVVARPHTGNWIASMNHGLRLARGDFVGFLHHDDFWLEGRVAAVREALAREPDTDLLLHPSWFVDEWGNRLGVWRCALPEGSLLEPRRVVARLLVQNFIAVPAPLFRREAALKVGELNENLWHSADWDFWLRLAALGKTTYLARPLTAYRIHSTAVTWTGTDGAATYRWQMDAILTRHLRAWGGRGPIGNTVGRVAHFSVEANIRLAAFAHGKPSRLMGLAARFFMLGPMGWYLYLRDSRILERVSARMRVGMLSWRFMRTDGVHH